MITPEEHDKNCELRKSSDTDLNFLTISSRPEVFCKKGVLKNFVKLTGNLCPSFF